MENKNNFNLKDFMDGVTKSMFGYLEFGDGYWVMGLITTLALTAFAAYLFVMSVSASPLVDRFTDKMSSVTANVVSIESEKTKTDVSPIVHQIAEGNRGEFTIEYVSFMHHNEAKDYFDSIKREFIGLNFQGSSEVLELENISDMNLVDDIRNFFEYGIQSDGNLYRVVCDYNAVYVIKVKAAEDAEETSKFLFGILGYR